MCFKTQISVIEKRSLELVTTYSPIVTNVDEKLLIPLDSVIGELESIFNCTRLENVPTQVNTLTELRIVFIFFI